MFKILNSNTCVNYDVDTHRYKIFAPENLCLKAGEFRTIDLGIVINEKQIKFNYLNFYDEYNDKELALEHYEQQFMNFLEDLQIGKDDCFEFEMMNHKDEYNTADIQYCKIDFKGKELWHKLKAHYLQIELSQNLISKGLLAMPLRVDFSYKGTLKIHIFASQYENMLEEIRGWKNENKKTRWINKKVQR